MSYVVSIKRPISKSELLEAIGNEEQFSILTEGEHHVDLLWAAGEEQTEFSLSQGEIIVTTPSDQALQRMERLACTLGAVVVGEEDDAPVRKEVKRGIFANRETWIGWPVLVIVLTALLIWKW